MKLEILQNQTLSYLFSTSSSAPKPEVQQKWRKQTYLNFLNLRNFQFNFWMKFHKEAERRFYWDDSLINCHHGIYINKQL